jgi:hypothetical protein
MYAGSNQAFLVVREYGQEEEIMATTINIVPVSSQSDADLVRAGWKKQTTLDEGRLREVADGYIALGYEVFVQEIRTDAGCTACFDTGRELGRSQGTVWIRPGRGERQDNELFD